MTIEELVKFNALETSIAEAARQVVVAEAAYETADAMLKAREQES